MKQYWLIRAGSKGEFWDEWNEKNIITIGCDIGNDLEQLSKEEIKNRIEKKYDIDFVSAFSQLSSFLSLHEDEEKRISQGDIILILGDATIEAIGEILDNKYKYNSKGLNTEKTHTYWKEVRYIFKNINLSIKDLPEKYRQGGTSPIHLVQTLKRYPTNPEDFNELVEILANEHLKLLIDYASQINKYKEDPQYFLVEIGNLPSYYLKERKKHYETLPLKKKGDNSVNTVRYIILDKIINKVSINIEDIEAIKQNIRYKNEDFFSDYPEIQNRVSQLERKGKNYFNSWTNFSILMQLYYDYDKVRINEVLDEIGAYFEKEFLLDLNYYSSDFIGNNNFGRDSCWMVFYPKRFESFKDCYQIILVFRPSSIEYGIGYGKNVDKIETDRKTVEFKDLNFTSFKNELKMYIPQLNKLNSIKIEPPPPPSDPEDLSSLQLYENTDIDIQKIKKALEFNYQIILMGPPGTSKSYLAYQIANELTDNNENIFFTQFHPEYSYDDFIEGKEPIGGEKLSLEFKPIKKRFLEICDKARENDEKYILILDEINRGNVEKIFGELIWALENREKPIELLYSRNDLIIPKNLYIIGTMNTVDLSIANIDAALRRRFFIIELMPDEIFLQNWFKEEFKDKFQEIQDRIVKFMHDLNSKIIKSDRINEYQSIGHTYFMMVKGEDIEQKLEFLKMSWEYSIKPLLLEYYQFNKDDIEEYLDLWDKFEEDINQFLELYRES